jgi:hypothetical protein
MDTLKLVNVMRMFPVLAMCAWMGSFANAGNEKSGGVPPPPIVVENPFSYSCSLSLTQRPSGHQALVRSRASFVATFQGNQTGNYLNFSEINNWQHFDLVPYGPFHQLKEVPISQLPEGAELRGMAALRLRYNMGGDPAFTSRTLINLTAAISHVTEKKEILNAEASADDSPESNQRMKVSVKLVTPENYELESVLEVSCVRNPSGR